MRGPAYTRQAQARYVRWFNKTGKVFLIYTPVEYIKGDRFSIEFIEHRRMDLQHFMDRLARHPTLQRSVLVNDFLQSTQWVSTSRATT